MSMVKFGNPDGEIGRYLKKERGDWGKRKPDMEIRR